MVSQALRVWLAFLLGLAYCSLAAAQPKFEGVSNVLFTVGHDVGPNGEYAFTRIRHLFQSGDRVHIVDEKSSAVRMYSFETGEYIGSYGRYGAGPGEFKDILSIYSRGDSLWLFDRENQLLTLNVNGDVQTSKAIGGQSFLAASRFKMTNDGSVVLYNSASKDNVVQCIDPASGQSSCSWLHAGLAFPASSFPVEAELGLAPFFKPVIENKDEVYLFRQSYDGRIWRANHDSNGERIAVGTDDDFAKDQVYEARFSDPYTLSEFSSWYDNDMTPKPGKEMPVAYQIYTNTRGETRFVLLHSMLLSSWKQNGTELVVAAYVLFRHDRDSDLWIDVWDGATLDIVSSRKIAHLPQRSNIYRFERATDGSFLIAWYDNGVPVWSKVQIDVQ